MSCLSVSMRYSKKSRGVDLVGMSCQSIVFRIPYKIVLPVDLENCTFSA